MLLFLCRLSRLNICRLPFIAKHSFISLQNFWSVTVKRLHLYTTQRPVILEQEEREVLTIVIHKSHTTLARRDVASVFQGVHNRRGT